MMAALVLETFSSKTTTRRRRVSFKAFRSTLVSRTAGRIVDAEPNERKEKEENFRWLSHVNDDGWQREKTCQKLTERLMRKSRRGRHYTEPSSLLLFLRLNQSLTLLFAFNLQPYSQEQHPFNGHIYKPSHFSFPLADGRGCFINSFPTPTVARLQTARVK